MSLDYLKNKKQKKGFTLIELLVVVAIISLLASVVMSGLNNAKMRGHDSRRVQDMKQIQYALELYYDENDSYPPNSDNDCGGWDTGFNGGQDSGDIFIQPLETGNYISHVSGDPISRGNCDGYRYYRYSAGYSGCDSNKGAFYVLGVVDMSTTGRPHPDSPGFSCPNRDWQNEFDWVVGSFENI